MIISAEQIFILKQIPTNKDYHLLRERTVFSSFTEDVFIKNKFYQELLIK